MTAILDDVQQNLRHRLMGWGRTNPGVADLVEVSAHEVADAVKGASERGVLVRGLGRSYGDAAQNSGGLVLRLAGSADHAETGTVTVPAGVSIDELLRVLVPQGWFVPVTPGTRFVTIGGAIASDIHGKNHHVEGSFGDHVTTLTLLLADGSVEAIGPDRRPELFWATVGGMGLTGVILEATFRLLPIESSRMLVDTCRVPDLESLFAAMTEGDDRYRYSVAWIDLLARGRQLGRSVLTRGDHAPRAALTSRASEPLAYGPRQMVTVPPVVPPSGLVKRSSVWAFNEFWFRKAPKQRVDELQSIASFFHPLDHVASWNRLYGRRGFVQYQFVVPFGSESAVRAVIEDLLEHGAASFLAVLKRFGPASSGPLSFPAPGWTLALDLPVVDGVSDLFRRLDRRVIDAGGRHYLAKDAHATPEVVRAGYPRLEEWKEVRRRVDPTGRWASDLARRLHLLD